MRFWFFPLLSEEGWLRHQQTLGWRRRGGVLIKLLSNRLEHEFDTIVHFLILKPQHGQSKPL